MVDKLTVPPAEEPVSLKEAKDHVRVLHDDEDGLIANLIGTARQTVEQDLQRALVTQTRALYLDAFLQLIELQVCPVRSIASIKYWDVDGVQQTLAADQYLLDEISEPARLVPATGASWPAAECRVNAIAVQYVTGYGGADDVPLPIKQAMLLLVGHFYTNRENSVIGTIATSLPFGVDALLSSYRLRSFI